MDDRALLRRIAAGDERALVDLYERHSTCLFSCALRWLRSEPSPRLVAEDVVLSTFTDLWQRAAQVDPTASTLAWLLCHVRTASQARLTVPRSVEATIALTLGATAHPQLSQLQQAAIELAWFDGLSMSEISACLGETPSTVRRAMVDGMQALKPNAGAGVLAGG